jgi:hypothetical protein
VSNLTLTFVVRIIFSTIIPVFGLLFLDWDWRQILIVYWLECFTFGVSELVNIKKQRGKLTENAIFFFGLYVASMISLGFPIFLGMISPNIGEGGSTFNGQTTTYTSEYDSYMMSLPPINMAPIFMTWLIASIISIITISSRITKSAKYEHSSNLSIDYSPLNATGWKGCGVEYCRIKLPHEHVVDDPEDAVFTRFFVRIAVLMVALFGGAFLMMLNNLHSAVVLFLIGFHFLYDTGTFLTGHFRERKEKN